MNRIPQVLLVDDNPADTDLAATPWHGAQGQVRCAPSPMANRPWISCIAWGSTRTSVSPDLVILDLNMPRKDGRAVLAEVKADPLLRTMPVVIFSTSRAGRDVVRSYELGAHSYVSKPGNLHDFVSAVAIHQCILVWLRIPDAQGGQVIDQPTRVLLIEDNPGDADLVRLRLVEGNSGLDVSCVDRLSAGLTSMSEKPPAVVLLDLNLPDSRGAETFRSLLKNAPGVPVVVLSGHDDEELATKALHQGVQDYLVKGTFNSKQLARAMRYAIERQALLTSLDMSRKQQLQFKDQFLSHVSHELRTPLTCIHQFVTILLDGLAGPIPPEQREHLETVLRSAQQLHSMIDDLLETTRAESGKLHIEPRCIAIGAVVEQAAAMLQATAQAKKVSLEVSIEEQNSPGSRRSQPGSASVDQPD